AIACGASAETGAAKGSRLQDIARTMTSPSLTTNPCSGQSPGVHRTIPGQFLVRSKPAVAEQAHSLAIAPLAVAGLSPEQRVGLLGLVSEGWDLRLLSCRRPPSRCSIVP